MKILKLYFEYVCQELVKKRKIAEITLGKIIQKTTLENQKTIELKVSNICFIYNLWYSKKKLVPVCSRH